MTAKTEIGPAAQRYDTLLANQAEEAKNLAAQIKRLRSHWHDIEIQSPVRKNRDRYRVGEKFEVTAEVNLAELQLRISQCGILIFLSMS